MVKKVTSVNIDADVKKEARGILKEKGLPLSFFIEQTLRELIMNERRLEKKRDVETKKIRL